MALDPQAPNPTLVKLLSQLKADGSSIEEATQVVQQMNDVASAQLYEQVLNAFSREEIVVLNEQTQTQEEADQKIIQLYKDKTGKDPDLEKEDMITELAQAYLDDYLKQKSQAQTS